MSATPPVPAAPPRSAVGRAGWPASRVGAGLAVAVVVAVVAGCAAVPSAAPTAVARPTPTPSPTANGAGGASLILLAEANGVLTLGLAGPAGGIVELPLPAPATAAVVPARDNGLLALLRDGRLFVAPGGPDALLDGRGWQQLDGGGIPLPGRAVIFAATLSPDATRLAALARPPDAEGPSALVLMDRDGGRRSVYGLAEESLGSPPAWIDNGRVAVLQRNRLGRTFLAIVDVGSGEVLDRISFRALEFRTSGDGQTAAVLGDNDRLLVGSTASVLERRAAPDGGPVPPPADHVVGGLALDGDGRHLAAIVDESNGGQGRVAVYELVGDAWQPGTRITPFPGSHGGAPAWLP